MPAADVTGTISAVDRSTSLTHVLLEEPEDWITLRRVRELSGRLVATLRVQARKGKLRAEQYVAPEFKGTPKEDIA